MKRISSILLGTIMTLSMLAAVGCGDQSAATPSGRSSQPQTQTIVPAVNIGEVVDGETMWNSFEYFDRDVQLIRLMDDFGRVSQNKDEEYIRSGSKSLKITPMERDSGSTSNPYMMIPSSSTRFSEELNFVNFTKVDYISLWFYNPQEEDIDIGVSAALGHTWDNQRKNWAHRITPEFFTLKEGWNHIVYEIMPGYLKLQGANMEGIYGVLLEFDTAQVMGRETPFSVYLDDLTLGYTDETKPQEIDYAANLKSGVSANGNQYWEITDFEDPRQAYYYVYRYGFPSPIQVYPYVRAVFAGDYGVQAKNGSHVLLIRKCYGDTYYGWPILRVEPNVMKATIDIIGDDIRQNPQKYAFKFNLYNASEVADYLGSFFDVRDVTYEIAVQPKQWVEFSLNMAQLDYTNGTAFELRWNTKGDHTYTNMLLDNVRIEKIA